MSKASSSNSSDDYPQARKPNAYDKILESISNNTNDSSYDKQLRKTYINNKENIENQKFLTLLKSEYLTKIITRKDKSQITLVLLEYTTNFQFKKLLEDADIDFISLIVRLKVNKLLKEENYKEIEEFLSAVSYDSRVLGYIYTISNKNFINPLEYGQIYYDEEVNSIDEVPSPKRQKLEQNNNYLDR